MIMERTLTPDTEIILRDLQALLNYHRLSGIESYPATEEIRGLLRMTTGMDLPQEVRRQRPPTAIGSAEKTVRPVEPPKLKRESSQRIQVSALHDIREEVMACNGCALSEKRVVPVPGGGAEKAKLLIVGDWLALVGGQKSPVGCVFGIEQDRMLGKMLEAIQLPKNNVFVTNVIKCGIADSCQPKAEHVRACVSFLHRQIVSIQPEVILSMGLIATRALLNRREPLSKLRGQLHVCSGPNDRKIPLIATYHPTFLLQNPEMKKATWLDLQLLARQLGLA
ncbi:DNA polymerase [Desulfopila aestuarii DSM 18488]|uniref:DNA polymerase n=2 Tax=Desulfopila aestuarii TaxID=231440 RepID=A0A1M7YIL8_9BACT|nr:DNA polymerase [Desulfopila aestuarii DSM 18488]